MNLRDIRAGLAQAIDNVPGVHVWAYVPDALIPPAAVVIPNDIDYHRSFNEGCQRVELRVRVYASKVSDRGSQDVLDDMLASHGTSSFRAAIEADPTLGGVCSSVSVGFAEGSYASYSVAETPYLGFELIVEVFA